MALMSLQKTLFLAVFKKSGRGREKPNLPNLILKIARKAFIHAGLRHF